MLESVRQYLALLLQLSMMIYSAFSSIGKSVYSTVSTFAPKEKGIILIDPRQLSITILHKHLFYYISRYSLLDYVNYVQKGNMGQSKTTKFYFSGGPFNQFVI